MKALMTSAADLAAAEAAEVSAGAAAEVKPSPPDTAVPSPPPSPPASECDEEEDSALVQLGVKEQAAVIVQRAWRMRAGHDATN